MKFEVGSLKFEMALAALALALLIGCAGGPLYTIEKGDHSSGAHFMPHFGATAVCADVYFTNAAQYELPGADQRDWNKLFGCSFGYDHTEWSFRFGWRWNPVKQYIEVCPYLHLGGLIVALDQRWQYVGPGLELLDAPPYIGLQPGVTYRFHAEWSGHYLNCAVYDAGSTVTYFCKWDQGRHKGDLSGWGYYLYPYFGGTTPAPHTMKIYVRRMDPAEWAASMPDTQGTTP